MVIEGATGCGQAAKDGTLDMNGAATRVRDGHVILASATNIHRAIEAASQSRILDIATGNWSSAGPRRSP